MLQYHHASQTRLRVRTCIVWLCEPLTHVGQEYLMPRQDNPKHTMFQLKSQCHRNSDTKGLELSDLLVNTGRLELMRVPMPV